MALRHVGLDLEHVDPLVALELIDFPTVDPTDLTSAETVRMQCATFPEGAFAVVDRDRVVEIVMGMFVGLDLDDPQRRIDDAIGPTEIEKARAAT